MSPHLAPQRKPQPLKGQYAGASQLHLGHDGGGEGGGGSEYEYRGGGGDCNASQSPFVHLSFGPTTHLHSPFREPLPPLPPGRVSVRSTDAESGRSICVPCNAMATLASSRTAPALSVSIDVSSVLIPLMSASTVSAKLWFSSSSESSSPR